MRFPSVAVLLSLSLAPCLAAQQSGPPANPITASFKGRILAAHRNLAQAFDSIPETLFSYKPTPAQLTIGYVAQHLASDNYFFCNNFGEQKSPQDPEAQTPDSVRASAIKPPTGSSSLISRPMPSYSNSVTWPRAFRKLANRPPV